MDQVGEMWATLSGVWWGIPVFVGVACMALMRLAALLMGWSWPSGDGGSTWPPDSGGGDASCGDGSD